MTTAHGSGGITTIGPQHPNRWILTMALLAITAVGIAAVTLIVTQSDSPSATAPAAVAPAEVVAPEVVPAPVPAAVAPAAAAPVLTAPMSLQELALITEAATGLIPTGILADETLSLGIAAEQMAGINHLLAHPSAIASGGALYESPLTGEEFALITEAATGLIPTGILAAETATQ